METIVLSQEHSKAVNRRRRITVQYDAACSFNTPVAEWIETHFAFVDRIADNQVDSIWWDLNMGCSTVYPSKILPRVCYEELQEWIDEGVDPLAVAVEQTRKRGLETFFALRMNGADVIKVALNDSAGRVRHELGELHPFKGAHKDWLMKAWGWPGFGNFEQQGETAWLQHFNYVVPQVREHMLALLRELAENYDLDGITVDFSRHAPHLPPGREWELRDHLTEFTEMARKMTLEVAAKRGRPLLLAAKVSATLDGCHRDGFDIEAWARQGLVDILCLGTRCFEVEVDAFRRVTAGRNIKLQSSIDDWHATDGYNNPPVEVFRGVCSNWWQQGLDSIMTMNWDNAAPETYRTASQLAAYSEIGSPQTLAGKNKVFVVERRLGHHRLMIEGYIGRNFDRQLPAALDIKGTDFDFTIGLGDNIAAVADNVKKLTLRAVLFGAQDDDEIEVRLNDVTLEMTEKDDTWKDPQIFSPNKQVNLGRIDRYHIEPDQKLLRLDYDVPPQLCRVGQNQISMRTVKRAGYEQGKNLVVEKLEVHLDYE